MKRRYINAASGREPASEPFRRLIRKEISTDEYIRGLERRVSERHRQSEGGNERERSEPVPEKN